MDTSKYTMSEISNEILFKMKQGGLQTKKIDFHKIVSEQIGAMSKPHVNISIDSGSFKYQKGTTWKASIIVSLFVLVQNLSSEGARRNAASELLIDITNVLIDENLGLELQNPLRPMNFINQTPDNFADAGYIIYKLDFSCSFLFEKTHEDSQDSGPFKSIMNYYYTQDPVDSIVDGQGLVSLSNILGGSAWSVYHFESIQGGSAGTQYQVVSINGGRAGSTY